MPACPCSCTDLLRLHLRPAAARDPRADAALRRPDGAVGLRVTQFSLLRTLAREGPSRMSALAEALLLDRTALSRTLDPLVERGLVAIVPAATRARARSR